MSSTGESHWRHRAASPSSSRHRQTAMQSAAATTSAQPKRQPASEVSGRAEPNSHRFLRPEENLRVLLIDDDRAMLDLLAVVFSTEGYQVTAATNVQDALAALEGAEQHVVLVDEQMLRHGNSRLYERLMMHGMPVIVLDPADPEHPAFPQATGVPTPPDVELLLALVAHFLAHPRPRRALPA